jgi:hypothetical protein
MNETEREIETMESDQTAPETIDAIEEVGAAQEASPRLVNVAEAIRYRKRAQAAEKELEQVRQSLAQSQQQSEEIQARLEQVERRAAIDARLMEVGAADLQAARLLVESALGGEQSSDVEAAIEEVQRERPHLFRFGSHRALAGAMGPTVPAADHGSRNIQRAAAVARRSGHNADVMHYMTLRRSASR